MLGDWHIRRARLAGAMMLSSFMLALAGVAGAQSTGSVQDFQLKPGAASPTPTPTVAGPVDPENPVAAPTRPAPAPAPTIAVPPVLTPSPAPAALASPRVTASAAPRPRAPAEATPTPSPAEPVPASPQATAGTAELAAPSSSEASPAPVSADESPTWPWAAAAAVLVAIGAAFVLLRRRREPAVDGQASDAHAQIEPSASPPAALPEANAALPSSESAAPPAAVPSPPQQLPSTPIDETAPQVAPARALDIVLEPRHLSRAMVNATLSYRLAVTNRAKEAFAPLRIAGDIITAHASLPQEDQLGPPDEALATIHQIPALAPGETAVVSGELRLPLASILPIQSGSARVFVPLARFRVAQGNVVATRVFVVGQASDRPGGALRPFLVDRGPGVERALDQRELAAAAA